MSTSSIKDSQTVDNINELAVLHWEAERFIEKLQAEVKTISEVYEGRELLTPATLLRCNVAIMIVHQLTANIARVAGLIKDKLPPDYTDGNGDVWLALSQDLVVESRRISAQAVSRAKEISHWASVKIDGRVYPDQA
jgi:hypothetical protein